MRIDCFLCGGSPCLRHDRVCGPCYDWAQQHDQPRRGYALRWLRQLSRYYPHIQDALKLNDTYLLDNTYQLGRRGIAWVRGVHDWPSPA